MRSSIFTRPAGRVLTLLGLALSLVVTACGSDPTPTPVPGTTAVFTSATNITLGDTTTVGPTPTNSPPAPTPSVSSPTDNGPVIVSPAVTVEPSTKAITPAPTLQATTIPIATSIAAGLSPTPGPALTLPLYDGFKPVNLGSLTTQLVQQFGQAGPSVRVVGYATSDNFSKLAAFYNREMPKLGYAQSQARDLPQGTLLNGKILLYSKDSGAFLDGLIIIGFGPLDRPTLSGFATDAPEVAALKDGDSLILVISGLNGAYLSNLQKTFTSGGLDTPTPGR